MNFAIRGRMASIGRKPKVCRYFKKHGHCRLGPKCTDLHSQQLLIETVPRATGSVKGPQFQIRELREQLAAQIAQHVADAKHWQDANASLKQSLWDEQSRGAAKTVQLDALRAEMKTKVAKLQEDADLAFRLRLQIDSLRSDVNTLVRRSSKIPAPEEEEKKKKGGGEEEESEWIEKEQTLWRFVGDDGKFENYFPEDSTKIETAWQAYLKKENEDPVTVVMNRGHAYVINFAGMTQTRFSTRCQRRIERWTGVAKTRNPAYIQKPARVFDRHLDECIFAERQHLVHLVSTDDEFAEIQKMFYASMPTTTAITRIERNMDPRSASLYVEARKWRENKSEKMLWHGFKGADLQLLLKEGLDVKMSGHSNMAGQAIYTSEQAIYSDRGYTVAGGEDGQTRILLLLRCLTGITKFYDTASHPLMHGIRKPPLFEAGRYDSVGYQDSPVAVHGGWIRSVSAPKSNLFSFYDNHQVHVAYIVRYQFPPS